MFKNAINKQGLLWLLLCISSIAAVARVDGKWSYKRSKVVAAQNYRGQTAFRAASVNSQTQFNQLQNNRTQFRQPNQTRPLWQQPSPSYPTNGHHTSLNQTRPTWPQPQAPNHGSYTAYGQKPSFNQTRNSVPNYPYPALGNFNQTWPQPSAPNVARNPTFPMNGQKASYNQIQPVWPQPSAPQLPNYPAGPITSNTWPPTTNQTNIYPKLPNSNAPQIPSANGIPSQSPHNWHSGGQAALSYGPGYHALPVANKTQPSNYGGSNPYANIFH